MLVYEQEWARSSKKIITENQACVKNSMHEALYIFSTVN